MTEEDTSVDGWTNWETRAIGLVLLNDEGFYLEAIQICRAYGDPEENMREWITEICTMEVGHFDGLREHDLEDVDWTELVESVTG